MHCARFIVFIFIVNEEHLVITLLQVEFERRAGQMQPPKPFQVLMSENCRSRHIVNGLINNVFVLGSAGRFHLFIMLAVV